MIQFNIGNILKQQEDFDLGKVYLEEARKGFEKTLGADHQFTKLAEKAIIECGSK